MNKHPLLFDLLVVPVSIFAVAFYFMFMLPSTGEAIVSCLENTNHTYETCKQLVGG